jgi:hypothetical protein
MRGADPNIAGGYEKGEPVATPTELATLRADNARLARDYTELRGDYDAVGGKLTVERKYSDELRAENARMRELMQAAIAWQATIRPDKADRTANISKEERALFFAVEETRAAIASQEPAR